MKFEEKDLQALWDRMDLLTEEEPSEDVRRGFDWMMRGARAAQYGSTRTVHPRALAVAAALLIVGTLAGLWWDGRTTPGSARPDRIVSVLAASGTRPSARLRAVEFLAASAENNRDALLRMAASDPNINVRLAVVDALLAVADDAAVAGRLPTLLEHEEDPLLRMALCDLAVAGNIRAAVPQLERIAQDPAQESLVAGKATWALRTLRQGRTKS